MNLFGPSDDEWAQLRSGIANLIERRPVGGYSLILADPPWRTAMRSAKGYKKSPERHYRTVPFPVLNSLPIGQLGATDSVLLVWGTAPHLKSQMQALEAWGYEYKSFAPWFKASKNSDDDIDDEDWNPSFGGGYLWRNCSEIMLIGTRGKPKLKPERRKERGAFFDPIREHSRKPDDQYRKAETLAAGPYLEIFSRTAAPGWVAFGDQAGTFEIAA